MCWEMIRAEFKLDLQQPHAQFQSNGVSVFLHFFWNLPGLSLPLEGQEALFITVLSAAEETLMETLEEDRLKPSVAQLEAEGAGCLLSALVLTGGLQPQRAAP